MLRRASVRFILPQSQQLNAADLRQLSLNSCSLPTFLLIFIWKNEITRKGKLIANMHSIRKKKYFARIEKMIYLPPPLFGTVKGLILFVINQRKCRRNFLGGLALVRIVFYALEN